MPDSPARQRLHDSSVDNPIGVINPIPVITTFLMRARLSTAVVENNFGEKDSGFFRGKQGAAVKVLADYSCTLIFDCHDFER